MGRQGYLIDTNAVIDYLGDKLNIQGMQFMSDVIDSQLNLSVISKIELLGFEASQTHLQLLADFVNDAAVFKLADDIADKTIELRQSYKIKLPDAIIAATAIVNNLTLISRNRKDFKPIAELDIIDVWQL